MYMYSIIPMLTSNFLWQCTAYCIQVLSPFFQCFVWKTLGTRYTYGAIGDVHLVCCEYVFQYPALLHLVFTATHHTLLGALKLEQVATVDAF